jgi:outer membrane immunogenic protein
MTRTLTSTRALFGVSALALALTFAAPQGAQAQGGLFGDMMGGPTDWSGPYIGVQAGYTWGDADEVFPGAPTADVRDRNVDGFLGGGHIGYNFQVQDVVFGAVADINYADVDGRESKSGPRSLSTDMEWNGSLRGKAGLVLGERVLVYATAGVAIAGIDHTHTGGALSQTYDRTYLGMTAGGGVEFQLTDMISAFVEGRWTQYGNENFGAGVFGFPHTFDFEHVQVMGGLSVRLGDIFGGP